MATATMVGQNLGAGQPQRARTSALLLLAAASVVLFATSVVFYIFPEALFRFFIADPEVIRHGVQYIRIIAIFEVFLAFEVVLEGAFTGAGDTKPPFVILFTGTLLRIPLSYLLAIRLGMGVSVVWIIIALTMMIKGVMMLVWFQRGKWMTKRI